MSPVLATSWLHTDVKTLQHTVLTDVICVICTFLLADCELQEDMEHAYAPAEAGASCRHAAELNSWGAATSGGTD